MILGNFDSLRYFLPEIAITATILLLILVHVAGKNRSDELVMGPVLNPICPGGRFGST